MNSAPVNRISTSPVTHYHLDLWGLSNGWIDTIQDRFHKAAPIGAESVKCLAQISCWGYFDDDEIKAVNRVVRPLLALAAKTYKGPCYYTHR